MGGQDAFRQKPAESQQKVRSKLFLFALNFHYLCTPKNMGMVDFSYKRIWTVAYPILISLVMEQLIGLTDTAFMGRVGEVELGASAIAGVFYLVVFMAGNGFCIGTQILMARRNGESNHGAIGGIFYQGLFFLVALAALLFALTQLFCKDILSLMISSPHVLEKAADYLQWRTYGFFFAFASGIFRAFFVGTTQTKTLTLNSAVMVLSNVAFNYLLVFGKLGLPAMGIAGAAIGSSLAELVSLAFFIVYTRSRIDCRKFGLNVLPRLNFKELRKILNISLWTMVQNIISLSTWFIFFVYIEHLGEQQLAVTNIVRSLSGFLFMILLAFASTCSSIVSNMLGAGQGGEVRKVINRHVKLTYAIILPIALLFVLMPRTFIAIYTDIPELLDASVGSVWVMCFSYLVLIPANIYFQSVSGTGDTRAAFMLEMAVLAVYMVYITVVILEMRVDVAWAWSSETVYGTFLFLLSGHYIRRGKWSRRRI